MGLKKLEVAHNGGGESQATSRGLATDLQVERGIARIRRSGDARIAALHTESRGVVSSATAHRLELAEGAARRHNRLTHVLQESARRNSRNGLRLMCRSRSAKGIARSVGRKGSRRKRTARVRAGVNESVDVDAGVTQISHNDEMRTATLVPASMRRMSTRVHFILYT